MPEVTPSRDDLALCRWLMLDHRRVLTELDDVWRTTRELQRLGLNPAVLRGILTTLRHVGLATYRRSDAHGRGEWARTERGDVVVASWEGTRWKP